MFGFNSSQMHCFCPHCNAGNYIHSQCRFEIFRCKSCGKRYRGIHAALDGSVANFFHRITNTITECPYCDEEVYLDGPYTGGFFRIPINCRNCHRKLPQGQAIQESKDRFDGDDVQEAWRQRKEEIEQEKEWNRPENVRQRQQQAQEQLRLQQEQKETDDLIRDLRYKSLYNRLKKAEYISQKENRPLGKVIKELNEKARQKKEEEKKVKEKQNQQGVELDDFIFWKDYVGAVYSEFVQTRPDANVNFLRQIEQGLLDDFKLSDKDNFIKALNVLNKRIEELEQKTP